MSTQRDVAATVERFAAVAAGCYDLLLKHDDGAEKLAPIFAALQDLPAAFARRLTVPECAPEPLAQAEFLDLDAAASALEFAAQELADHLNQPYLPADQPLRVQLADCVEQFRNFASIPAQAAPAEENDLGPDLTEHIVALALAQDALFELAARIRPDTPDAVGVLASLTRLMQIPDIIAEGVDALPREREAALPSAPVRRRDHLRLVAYNPGVASPGRPGGAD